MATEYFNRYKGFVSDGDYKTLPFLKLSVKDTDKYETYVRNRTRFDILSQKYYGNPWYTWLILQANPQFGGLEFNIPNSSQIRIPYPLETTLSEYDNKLKQHKKLYGN